jgi:hypothetical protein
MNRIEILCLKEDFDLTITGFQIISQNIICKNTKKQEFDEPLFA